MNALLARTRQEFGSPPRTITTSDKVEPPSYMSRTDPLRAVYARIPELLRTGHVAWGVVVQANSLLFRPGGSDHPCHVVFGAKRAEDVAPDRLRRIAAAVFSLKKTSPRDPALANIANAVTNEAGRHPPLDLPVSITHGCAARLGVIMVHRGLLPSRYLTTNTLPLLVGESGTDVAMLPQRFWAPDLVQGWRDLGETG